jgi:hypothetical protein
MTKLLAFAVGTILLLALLTGLWVWYGRRWRYYKRATSMAQILFYGGFGVTNWIYLPGKYRLFPILCVLACLFPAYELIKEFRNQEPLAKPQQTGVIAAGKE